MSDKDLSKPIAWPNGCDKTVVEALKYLAENKRPIGGSSRYNTEHLYMIARELMFMSAQNLYSEEYVQSLLEALEAAEQHANLTEAERQAYLGLIYQRDERIAELESRLAKPVMLPKTNGYWTEQEKVYEEAITLAKRQVRLAGFRCEGDE